jgi:hypothetical protein
VEMSFADKLIPVEGAWAHLIWELRTASGKDLKRALREARKYARHYSDDHKVAEALDRAERRLREQEAR